MGVQHHLKLRNTHTCSVSKFRRALCITWLLSTSAVVVAPDPLGQNRGRMVDFLFSQLQGKGPERYSLVLDAFSNELKSRGQLLSDMSEEALDWGLAEYVLDLYEQHYTIENFSKAATTVAALSKANP